MKTSFSFCVALLALACVAGCCTKSKRVDTTRQESTVIHQEPVVAPDKEIK
jgi:hypothetical protein